MGELLPQKRVLGLLGISRSGLWRAINAGIEDFPPPTRIRTRVYWREDELPALKAALKRFQGRPTFDQERRHTKARVARAQAAAIPVKKRRAPVKLAQPDLFGDADAVAPSGAQRRR